MFFLCHCQPRQRSLQYRKESSCFLFSFFVRERSWAEVLVLLQSGGNALESQAHILIDMVHFLFWDQIDLVLILLICPKGLFWHQLYLHVVTICIYHSSFQHLVGCYLSQYLIWSIINIILNSSSSTLHTSWEHNHCDLECPYHHLAPQCAPTSPTP